MMAEVRARAGIEIGGTFTDLIWLRPDGSLGFAKVHSTPDAPERAALDRAGIDPVALPVLVHGSTVATGPCVIDESTPTTFVLADWMFAVDERGCLVVRRDT